MSKKYLGFICFIYSAIIFYVWISGLLRNFLAPNMQLYLKISAFVFIPMGLVLLFNNRVNYKFKISDLILLLPIVLLIIAGDGRLTASLANNRFNNISSNKNVINENKEENKEEVEEEKNIEDIETVLLELPEEKIQITTTTPKADEKKYYFDIIDSSYVDLANYLTFGSTSNKYDGYSIRVKGFAVTKSSFLPEGYFLLGKYGSNCCVADSTFTGFYVKYDPSNVTKNNWYELTGVLREGKDADGLPIMYIEVDSLNEIDSSKEETYVWPCYTYDDGLCKEVQKYNLEY